MVPDWYTTGKGLLNTLRLNVLRKAVFCIAKHGLSHCNSWPFGMQEAAFRTAERRLSFHVQLCELCHITVTFAVLPLLLTMYRPLGRAMRLLPGLPLTAATTAPDGL